MENIIILRGRIFSSSCLEKNLSITLLNTYSQQTLCGSCKAFEHHFEYMPRMCSFRYSEPKIYLSVLLKKSYIYQQVYMLLAELSEYLCLIEIELTRYWHGWSGIVAVALILFLVHSSITIYELYFSTRDGGVSSVL